MVGGTMGCRDDARWVHGALPRKLVVIAQDIDEVLGNVALELLRFTVKQAHGVVAHVLRLVNAGRASDCRMVSRWLVGCVRACDRLSGLTQHRTKNTN